MDILNARQMSIDLEDLLARDHEFLDRSEIPANPYTLNLVGFGLRRRYLDQHDITDIKRAAQVLELAVQKTSVASVEWLSSVNSLGKTYYLYYARTSNVYYLHRTIRLSEQLIEHTQSDSTYLAHFLHYLASYLVIRARVTQNEHDMKRSILAWKEGIYLTAPSSPYRRIYIARLFYCLVNYSYSAEEDLMDLENARDLLKLFLDEPYIDPSKCSIVIGIMGDCMLKYFFQTKDVFAINTIVHCWEQLIRATPSESAYQPDLNRLLSMSLLARFLHVMNVHDLHRAIKKQELALSLCRLNTPKYIQNVHDLGRALLFRFKITGMPGDLNRAIVLLEQALAPLPAVSPARPAYQEGLAEALQIRFEVTENLTDLQRANQLREQL